MAYVKLFSSILQSSLWQHDLATKVVWITMLALADRDGLVSASVPGLAHTAGVSMEDCERAIKVLMSPDPYSRTPDHEGRRIEKVTDGWELLNHAKYRALESAENRREKTAARVRKHRGATAAAPVTSQVPSVTERYSVADVTPCNADVTPGNGCNGIRSETDQIQKEGERAPARTRGPLAEDGDSSNAAAPSRPSGDQTGHSVDLAHERPVKRQPGGNPEIEQLPLAEAVATVPDWATALVGTAEMSGYRGDAKSDWTTFVAHIFACRSRNEMRRVDQGEWLKWLTRSARQPQSGRGAPPPAKAIARETRRLPPEERPTKPTSGSLLDYIKDPPLDPTSEGDS